MRKTILLVLMVVFLSVFAAAQQPTPMPNTYIHDFANVVAPEKEAEIQAKAERLKTEFKTEIAVVTIETFGGQSSFDYSMKMARSWGIGAKEEDSRGLLILVATKDRKIAFRTSRHTEGELTDGITGEISREMGGFFKQGQWGEGLSKGMDRVLEKTQARYEAPKGNAPTVGAPVKSGGTSTGWLLLLLPLGLLAYLVFRPRRRFRSNYGSAFGSTHTVTPAVVSASPTTASILASTPTRTYSTPQSRSSYTPSRSSSRSTPKKASSSSSSRSSSSESSSYTPPSYTPDPTPSYTAPDPTPSYGGSSDFGGGGADTSF